MSKFRYLLVLAMHVSCRSTAPEKKFEENFNTVYQHHLREVIAKAKREGDCGCVRYQMYIELEHFARIEMFKTHTHLFTGSHKKKTVDIGFCYNKCGAHSRAEPQNKKTSPLYNIRTGDANFRYTAVCGVSQWDMFPDGLYIEGKPFRPEIVVGNCSETYVQHLETLG